MKLPATHCQVLSLKKHWVLKLSLFREIIATIFSESSMMRKKHVLGLLFLLNGTESVCAQESKQAVSSDTAIRVNVNRVNLGVIVSDSHGHSIKGLRREDFKVFDNGVQQPITAFASNEEPARVVFLIESSTADYFLAKLGKSLFAGAENLLNSISPADRVASVTYSSNPQVVLDFTDDKIAARLTLRHLNAQMLNIKAGSGAMNLSSSVIATLEWLASLPGNKTIVLLSTGIDTSPPETWQIVQKQLQISDVRILAVSGFGDFREPAKKRKLSSDDRAERAYLKQGIAEADGTLHQLSGAAGGHIYLPKNAKDFDRAYAEISQLVRGEYNLEFVPVSLDGRLHALKVKVKGSSHHIDHRQAYVALPSAPRSP